MSFSNLSHVLIHSWNEQEHFINWSTFDIDIKSDNDFKKLNPASLQSQSVQKGRRVAVEISCNTAHFSFTVLVALNI